MTILERNGGYKIELSRTFKDKKIKRQNEKFM